MAKTVSAPIDQMSPALCRGAFGAPRRSLSTRRSRVRRGTLQPFQSVSIYFEHTQ